MKLKVVGKEKLKIKDAVYVKFYGVTDEKLSSSPGSNYGGNMTMSFMVPYAAEHDKIMINGEYTISERSYFKDGVRVSRPIGLE